MLLDMICRLVGDPRHSSPLLANETRLLLLESESMARRRIDRWTACEREREDVSVHSRCETGGTSVGVESIKSFALILLIM